MIHIIECKPSLIRKNEWVGEHTSNIHINDVGVLYLKTGDITKTYVHTKVTKGNPCDRCAFNRKNSKGAHVSGVCLAILGCAKYYMCYTDAENTLEEL